MKRLLLIIIAGFVGGAFTNCTDMNTDLNIETNTRLVYIMNSYPTELLQYQHTWVAGEESHTIYMLVAYAGLPLDVPVKFKFAQNNFPAESASEGTKLTFGQLNTTYELQEEYVIPVGEKSVVVPIKFIRDPNRVNVGPGQVYSTGWKTVFDFIILNEEELIEHDCRMIRTDNQIYVKEMSVRQ